MDAGDAARIVHGAVPDLGADDRAADGAADVASQREFAALLDRRDVRAVFQPMVDLRTGEIVALEALARGPVSSTFASPLALFAAARVAGRVAELDWVCRAAAFREFLDADVSPALSLFVNVEPEAIASDCPADLLPFVTRAEAVLRVFVEITDRALAADPAGVLVAVDRAREMGWGIAIDDVGATRAPLAVLPLVEADLIKLDLNRLKRASVVDHSAIVAGVLRHIEMSSASLLVEGIESAADARWARSLGAIYGQGMFLGAPGPLDDHYLAPRAPVRLVRDSRTRYEFSSPFEMLADHRYQRIDRASLEILAMTLAFSPRSVGAWPVFIVGLSRDGQLPPAVVEHSLPDRTLLFVVFGTDLSEEPMPGVRGVRLEPDDPLADERFLIVLSDQAPMAIFARHSTDGLFDVVVTQDPEVGYGIAQFLMRRMPGPGPSNTAVGTAALVAVEQVGVGQVGYLPQADGQPACERAEDLAPPSATTRSGWRRHFERHA